MSERESSWSYAAESSSGSIVRGLMSGDRAEVVETALRRRGLIPISIRPATSLWRAGNFGTPQFGARGAALQTEEIAYFSTQLRDLLNAGMPVLEALRLAMSCASNSTQRVLLQHLVGQVTSGKTVSAALRNGPQSVPQFVVTLVEVGESTGDLAGQFGRISTHYAARLALEREFRSKLAYPLALVVLTCATVLFLAFVVLPQFEGVFAFAGAAPPPETALALGFGKFVRDYWLISMLAGFGVVMGARHFMRVRRGEFERLCLGAPWLGSLLRYREYSSFFQTLSAMLSGGTPLARAMPLATRSVRIERVRRELAAAEAEVRVGARLEAALKQRTSCPGELIALLAVGEETGDLGKFSSHAATHAQGVVDRSLTRIMALLSPLLTILMGFLTAGVIASVLTGVLSLNDAIG